MADFIIMTETGIVTEDRNIPSQITRFDHKRGLYITRNEADYFLGHHSRGDTDTYTRDGRGIHLVS